MHIAGIGLLDTACVFRRILFTDFQKLNFEFLEFDDWERARDIHTHLSKCHIRLDLFVLDLKDCLIDRTHLFIKFGHEVRGYIGILSVMKIEFLECIWFNKKSKKY